MNLPQRVQVEADGTGRPQAIADMMKDGERPGGTRSGKRIEEILDTWRIDDEWWRSPITRRYVEVVVEGGAHLVLFQDLTSGAWFVQMP